MSRHRILVVDDEPGIVAALKLLFGKKGYKVKVAGRAAAATETGSASRI
jgi:DNA-binding response OmpR family regulator